MFCVVAPNKKLTRFIRMRLSAVGKSPREASIEATGNPEAIRNILRGKSFNPRSDTLAKLAKVLGVAPEELMRAALPGSGAFEIAPLSRTQDQGILVLGEVAAGVWREVPIDNGQEGVALPILPDPRHPAERQFGVVVRGESINKVAKDGDYLICLAPDDDVRHSIKDGDLVVLERIRPDGLREVTVKRVRHAFDGWEFWSESTDPRYSGAINLNEDLSQDGDGIEVRIIGIVLWTVGYLGR